MTSTVAIDKIKKYTGRKSFQIGNRAAISFSATLTMKAKNKNNINILLVKIVKQLKESKKLNHSGIKFLKTEID
jgi:hypothetical protein